MPSAFSVSLMAEYNVCTQTNAQTSTGPGDGAANCVATTTVAQRCESISEKFPQLLPLIHSPAFADISRKKQLALPLPAVRIPPQSDKHTLYRRRFIYSLKHLTTKGICGGEKKKKYKFKRRQMTLRVISGYLSAHL